MSKIGLNAALNTGSKGGPSAAHLTRWERVLMRRPSLVLPRLQAGMRSRDAAQARAALQGAFFVLERWGRAAELQDELQAALDLAKVQRALPEAAELSEALGRLHYQRGDYSSACSAWSQALEEARDDSRAACLARIGLAHLCYALGDWARGGRVLDQAELHYPRLAHDPYLRAKIALNRAVSLRATHGPQAAQPALDEALSAARETGHRDYQAEAIWQHARCARDSGDAVLALSLTQQALRLSECCGYRWLQAQSQMLVSELSTGDAAIEGATQALALSEQLQSRALQSTAHLRLADLMAERGEWGPSWHHRQQGERLATTLHHNQLPTQLEALARFDTDPTGADALLLELAGKPGPLRQAADFEQAWGQLQPRLIESLGLVGAQLWWDRSGEGRYQELSDPAESAAALLTPKISGYLKALSRSAEPLAVESLEHPWEAELGSALSSAAPPQSRLELGLRVDGRMVAFLWLQRDAGSAWPRADVSRALRLAALLERRLGTLEQALQRRAPIGLDQLRAIVEQARTLSQLASDSSSSRRDLATAALQFAQHVEHAGRQWLNSAAREP